MGAFRKWLLARLGNDNLEFLAHTRNYMSATVVQSVLMALTIPIITGFLLPGEYGILSVFVSLYSLLSIFFSLNLRSGIVRYYLEFRGDFDKSLSANLMLTGVATGSLCGVTFLLAPSLADWMGIPVRVFYLSICTAAFSGVLEIYLSYLRGSKQSTVFSLITVLRTALILAGAIALMIGMDKHRYMGKVYAELFVIGTMSMYALISMIRLSRFSTDFKYLRYTCRFSLPLIPHALSRYILGYFDRIIILQLTTRTATGLYSLVYDISLAMEVVVMSTIKAWQPIFFEEYRLGNVSKIERMAIAYSGYMYFAAIAIICYGADIARLFIPDNYFPGLSLLPVLIIGYIFVFLYTLYFQYASFHKRTELISISTLLAGGANIGLNYGFIPLYGYEAAAYTTAASFGLLFLFHYINARFILKANVLRLRVLLPNFAIVCAVGLGIIIGNTLELSPVLWHVIKLGITGAGFYYFIVVVAQGRQQHDR